MSRSPFNSELSDVKTYSRAIRELVCNVRDAVVSITGQAVLTNVSGTPSMVSYQGNGFFIKGHYIICPASLVLISPDLLITNSRVPAYPSISAVFDSDPKDPKDPKDLKNPKDPKNSKKKYSNALVRVSRILVDISNVNGSGKSFTYEADIVGIDGAANLAILRISATSSWNTCNPPLRICHTVLQWGKSRSLCPGDTIMVIGNTTAPAVIANSDTILSGAENSVSLGIVSDNRYVFPGGHVPGELLLLSNILPHGRQQGLPIITMNGTVVGMILHIHPSPYNVGLSEFFMRRSVKALIRSYQDNVVPERYQGFVSTIVDPIGNYYRFNKAWLGIAGILMDAQDYDTNLAFRNESDVNTLTRVPILEDGTLISDLSCKEIVGYRVVAVAAPTTADGIFIPGSAPVGSLIPSLKVSPLYNIINPGDIITHINDCPLGDRKGQIAPSLVMWRVQPGNTVKITYKKQAERFHQAHEVIVESDSYQPFLDFPFYARFEVPFRSMLPTLL